MNTNQGSPPPIGPGLGPSAGTRSRPVEMSRAQSRVLSAVEDAPEPVTLSGLSAATGLHANTLREHLDGLVASGLVHRQRARPSGPGRPRTVYEAVPGEPVDGREYAGLAKTLAATIRQTSSNPRRDATDAGERWGHELAAERGWRPGRDAPRARREVVAMLAEIGFAPETDRAAAVVRLTRCPLLEAARRYPEVVCAVHLGIVRGGLEAQGADPESAELIAFAEPGACLLHLDKPR